MFFLQDIPQTVQCAFSLSKLSLNAISRAVVSKERMAGLGSNPAQTKFTPLTNPSSTNVSVSFGIKNCTSSINTVSKLWDQYCNYPLQVQGQLLLNIYDLTYRV